MGAERETVRRQEAALADALVQTESLEVDGRLSVLALGPLRVERYGVTFKRWAGEKAATRQAEAMFAFLFDRGERGAAKDECLEVIWPAVPLDRAALAFHRTLGLLSHVLPCRSLIVATAVFIEDLFEP